MKDTNTRKEASAAYERGWRDARNELLIALKGHPLRAELLKALAEKRYGEKQ